LIVRTMLEAGREALLNLMQALKNGNCNGVQVKLGQLNQLALTAGTERIDFLHDFGFTQAPLQAALVAPFSLSANLQKSWPLSHTEEFRLECETNIDLLLASLRVSDNLYEQIELLQVLFRLRGGDFNTEFGEASQAVTVADLLDEIYSTAGRFQLWAIVRRAAGLLHKVDVSLSDAVTDILVRQKQISVGKSYSEAALITQPMPHFEVMDKICEFCGEDVRDRVLTQEILIYCGMLLKAEPHLFEGLLTLRVGYLILLITSELAVELNVTQDEAYERLMQLSPFETKMRLRKVLMGYESLNQSLFQQETLQLNEVAEHIDWIVEPDSNQAEEQPGSWLRKRQQQGTVNRVPKNFYPRVWQLLQHCKGLVIGDKLERRNRLDSELILSEMTPDEKNFALQVEHLLNKIPAPAYRQLNIETLMELAALTQANPSLQIEAYIVLDVLIGHAVRQAFLDQFPEKVEQYDDHKAAAWQSFYNSSPYVCASYVMRALRFLTQAAEASEEALPVN
ncbi:MAG TPA: glycoside hydrolase family 15 protein, partial [Candidatus Caenarcaniphilales bacterium]